MGTGICTYRGYLCNILIRATILMRVGTLVPPTPRHAYSERRKRQCDSSGFQVATCLAFAVGSGVG